MERNTAHWRTEEILAFGNTEYSVERGELMRLIFEVVDTTTWPKTLAHPTEIPESVMRCVLLYCLVANLCGSQEIVESCEARPAVRYLATNYRPEWATIHQFRRQNMNPLKQAVTRILQALGVNDAIVEAEKRFHRAIQQDSMVLDS